MNLREIDGVLVDPDLADILDDVSAEEWAFFNTSEDLSDRLAARMDAAGVSKTELAKRMGTSRAFITKVLRGDANLTIKTLTRIAHHLDAKVEFTICNANDDVQWTGTPRPRVNRVRHELAAKHYSLAESTSPFQFQGEVCPAARAA